MIHATIVCNSRPPSWKHFVRAFERLFLYLYWNCDNIINGEYKHILLNLVEWFKRFIHKMVSCTIIYYIWPPSWKLYFFKVAEVFHSLLNHKQYIKIHRI